MLGADWTGHPTAITQRGCCFLVFFAGGAHGSSATGVSGTAVVRVHVMTGTYATQYINSGRYCGDKVTALKAAHLGLLRGLRQCITTGWGPVHVIGGSKGVMQQQTTRRPPRAKPLRGTFWKLRRTADAVSVVSWTEQPREYNKTATELARLARLTERSIDWNVREQPIEGQRWRSITDYIQTDVAQWLIAHEQSTLAEGAAAKV
ncbi:hypothetical protein PR002_g28978 [Phytophthora rubi]|uniref:RNase H type-1 domain-containing protein n=1 Tax=Phytophthora rubi TaxID=129364 RepID=A0A6A3H601_9STRA|nr:hypothetical protein PR002_g28978 [Phytophthora rubi]